ncbi:MAG: sugar transporter [Bacteroidetes bacterium]|nr:sugar transporter [Bacteroidota bacterium]
MKKIGLAIGIIVFSISSLAAQQKVAWSYSAKKKEGNKYELHITATPPTGWHIYSQNTPDGGPIATSFTFNKNALVTMQGKVQEKGKLVTYFDKNFKVDVKYFEGKVEFIQVITVKGKAKTNVTGEVESMICNDHQCLPPTTEKFAIAL